MPQTSRFLIFSPLVFSGMMFSILAGCSSQMSTGTDPDANAILELTGGIAEDRLVLAKFGATWCGPCRQVDEELDKLQASDGQRVRVVKIDIDDFPQLGQKFGVESIPHMFLIDGDTVVDQTVGYRSYSKLQQWISSSAPPKAGELKVNPYVDSATDG